MNAPPGAWVCGGGDTAGCVSWPQGPGPVRSTAGGSGFARLTVLTVGTSEKADFELWTFSDFLLPTDSSSFRHLMSSL